MQHNRRCGLTVWLFALAAIRLSAQTYCQAPANAIVAENCLPGNPSTEWDIAERSGDPTIQGFATDISVNRGQTVFFKVKTDATSYRLDIYRVGYYSGKGARKVATVTPSVSLPQSQPACLSDVATGLIDCGNWTVSASWAVPATAVSGIYMTKVVRTDGSTGTGSSHIFFVVRDDTGHSDILYQTSDTTWQAYNDYGGNSLYTGAPVGRAYKVSYNRPFITRANQYGVHTFFFSNEYPMVRWLESNGYNISYSTGVDTDRRGAELLEHKVFLSSGHDEYWSGVQRSNVEAARDAGIHLAFFSGNEVFWKTRWENSIDGLNTDHRTLVCYKETHANAKIDPSPLWTGTWRDPRFSPPSDGGRPENSLTGTIFKVNCCEAGAITVSQSEGKMRLWRNTSFATLASGQIGTTSSGVLGFEWDEAPDDVNTPPGLLRLSTTRYSVGTYLLDYGSTYGSAPTNPTHSLTLYKRPSGAYVFSAGTVRWSWGLDSTHEDGSSIPDPQMRQATVNLFADFGVQPGSRNIDLVAAVASTDNTPPVSAFSYPVNGSSIQIGTPITIAGTSSDGAGTVTIVEISTDGGTTWHRATGTASWTYQWTPIQTGPVTLKSRATDDSGNLETQLPAISVTITPKTCPCTIWSASTTPAFTSAGDSSAVELGLRFRTSQQGSATGVRFYKGAGNTGVHVGKLWSNTGTLLRSVTFTNETSTGWQQAQFSAPVLLTPNTTYVVSYFAPNGGYAYNTAFFGSAVDNPPLRALTNGEDGPNATYLYAPSGGFPVNSGNGSNYWVDVVFDDGVTSTNQAPLTASDFYVTTMDQPLTIPGPGVLSNDSDPNGDAITALLAAPPTHGTVTLNSNGGFTYTPTTGFIGTDSFTYTAKDAALSSSPTTVTIAVCPCTIWPATATPTVSAATDSGSVVLGLKFKPNRDGYISGIRFYKDATNTGTHTGHLWTAAGVLLASVTFTSETQSGWQQASFGSAIAVAANTTYVISYLAPNGHYSFTAGQLTNTIDSPPLRALATGEEGGNGVYLYSTTGGYPSNASNGANYWVDAIFRTTPLNGNQAPVAANDTYSVAAGQTLTVGSPGLLGNDSDSNGDVLSAIKLTDPSSGTVTVAANGGMTYIPAASFTGTVSFTYKATDGQLDSNIATVTINVTPPSNLAPVATTDRYVASMGQALTVPAPGVLANDTDPNGDAITATLLTSPANGTVVLNANGGFLYTPNSGFTGADSFTYRATDGMATSNTATVTLRVCPCTIWSSTATPSVPVVSDTGSVELGTKFRVSQTGSITGIRFYKGAGATGQHVGNLWSSSGTLLASVTFTSETASGWQEATFSAPVSVVPGVTYVASYFAPNGRYSYSSGYFAQAVDNSPLRALANGEDGGNGTYKYGSTSSFPANPSNSSNYWIDVVFTVGTNTSNQAPVASTDAYTGTLGQALSVAAPGVLGNDFDPNGNTLTASISTAPAHGTVTLNSNGSFVYTPSVGFSGVDTFSYRANDGAAFSNVAVVNIRVCPCTIWSTSDTPAVPSANDTASAEVGVKFRSAENGFIAGVRFYKGSGNSGTHVGKLWTATGTLLASVTFTGESASGWQEALFSSPVAITANTVYVVSYSAPNGRYSYTSSFFGTATNTNPLTALSNAESSGNGVYVYTSTAAFPSNSFNSSNYWVDAVFVK